MQLIRQWLLAGLCAISMGAQAAPPVAFAPVLAGRPLAFPADFGAHPDFKTEWWYVTGWLQRPDGRPLGFQVTFFRSRTGAADSNPSAFAARQLIVAHVAVSDPALGQLVHDQRSGRQGFDLNHAKQGITDLKLDDWTMRRGPDGVYQVAIASRQLQLKLTLTPTAPLLLQGQAGDGFSQKGPQARHASYYYSEPQLKVTGVAGAGPASAAAGAVSGSAWLDHEWSSEALDPAASGWDWVGANLADGSALMAFQIRSKRGGKLWAHAVLRDRAGKLTRFGPDQVSFNPRAWWKSPASGANYPVATTLVTGSTSWRLTPLQNDQELDSRRSTGAIYWEGAMSLERDGQPVGHGYLEMTGYDKPMTL